MVALPLKALLRLFSSKFLPKRVAMNIRIIVLAVICVITTLGTLPSAQAQPSCAIVADPLILLVGTWIFDMEGFAPPPMPFASAGQFMATIRTVNGVEVPRLTITRSTSDGVRQEIDTGSYQIFDDCSGGTLIFNTSTRPFQFDFWFDELFGEIRFVSTNPGFVIVGSAERILTPDSTLGEKPAPLSPWSTGQRRKFKQPRQYGIDNRR
jgi:hypothetical protein